MSIEPMMIEPHIDEIVEQATKIEGFLSDIEMRFLVIAGFCSTTEGNVLEIGSFKGKSTFILSKSAGISGNPRISAIDPLTSPSKTDPDLKGQDSGWNDFKHNLKSNGVFDDVDFHRTTSQEVAKNWDLPIRLLWIDGDHTYTGTKSDFDNFSPYLKDRGIIAIHDVLQRFDGGIRVFCEDILLSEHFGPCGFVGSIGWAQYFDDPKETKPYHSLKLKFYKSLTKMIPYVVFDQEPSRFRRHRFRKYRSKIPHKKFCYKKWMQMVQKS